MRQLPSDVVDKCKVIADFYCIKEPVGDDAIGEGACPGDDGGDGQGQGSSQKSPRGSRKWLIQHVMFPMMKLHLRPHKKRATDGSVVEVARLEKLYRVFERC